MRILPGCYRLRNAVYLRSKVRILGSGADTVLLKEPSITTKLAADSDWYDQEITLMDAKGFQLGDGVCLRTRNPHHGGTDVCKRTLGGAERQPLQAQSAPGKTSGSKGTRPFPPCFPC